jgi:hypothetical protein
MRLTIRNAGFVAILVQNYLMVIPIILRVSLEPRSKPIAQAVILVDLGSWEYQFLSFRDEQAIKALQPSRHLPNHGDTSEFYLVADELIAF